MNDEHPLWTKLIPLIRRADERDTVIIAGRKIVPLPQDWSSAKLTTTQRKLNQKFLARIHYRHNESLTDERYDDFDDIKRLRTYFERMFLEEQVFHWNRSKSFIVLIYGAYRPRINAGTLRICLGSEYIMSAVPDNPFFCIYNKTGARLFNREQLTSIQPSDRYIKKNTKNR